MKLRASRLIVLAVAAAMAATASPALAGTSFDFLFSTSRVSDDNQLFLNLTVSSFGYSRPVLEPVLPRLRSVESDLPVVLFLSERSGRHIDFIVGLRQRGLSWAVVFEKCRVPMGALFAGIEEDPGPPYGRAWGYWKKNPRVYRVSDSDVCGLVQVQVGHRLVGTPCSELMRMRSSGRPVTVIVADSKGRPYRGTVGREGPPGHSRGVGHGRGRR